MMQASTQFERILHGFDLFSSLGHLIDDSGSSNNGDFYIQRLDEKKFRLVLDILDYMDLNYTVNAPYSLIYDSDFYVEEDVPKHFNSFNSYTIAMIIHKKDIERKFMD